MPNNCQRPELCMLSETCVPCAICPNAKEKADERLALTPCSDWFFVGWTRLYDKLTANKNYTDGQAMNRQSYAFVRMAKYCFKQNDQ